MKNKYYNTFEFKAAIEFLHKDPEYAKLKFEEYIKNYPYDYSSYPYYISCLIMLGNLEEAEIYINYIKNINFINNININFDLKKLNFIRNNIIFSYAKLLCYQHKYDELYKLLMENYSIVDDFNLSSVFYYCQKKLNILNDTCRIGKKYLQRQVIDYSESDFLDHIKKHLPNFNKYLDCPNSSIFAYDFPTDEIIKNIKNFIPSKNRMFVGFYDDTYFFKYDYCGKDNNKYTNYFKVVCFHDTNNIITMCPTINCDNLPYIDLNYLKQSTDIKEVNVRKLSQIEKFNKRYNLS